MGRPSIMVDHQDNAQIGATLLNSRHWKCVWFDPIVAVFVHDSYAEPVEKHAVDFAARHFRPDPALDPRGLPALLAAAKGLRNYANFLVVRGNAPRPLIWLGLDYARRIVETDPDSAEGWKAIAQIESNRDPVAQPGPRFRMPFDPVLDLSAIRATYAYRRAVEQAPRDFMAVMGLAKLYEVRQMREAMLPLLDRLVELPTVNQLQRMQQAIAESDRARLRQELGSPPREDWKNLAELDHVVTELLAAGRAETAAGLLEKAYPAARASWDVIDRIATLRLHLGEPEKARTLWRAASSVPAPGVRDARIGAALLAEGQFDAARKAYEAALKADPSLFEARYGLAILEQDAGRASAAYEHARAAIESGPSDVGRAAARAVASAVSRFARKESSGAVSMSGSHSSE
jgi:tetratricopeptide (TPR) repeat protein